MIWHYGDIRRSISTGAVYSGILFYSDFSGFLHAVDIKTGKPFWKHDMFAAIWGSPMVIDGKVYLGDEDGDVTVMAADQAMKVIAENNMGSSVYSTPVPANGRNLPRQSQPALLDRRSQIATTPVPVLKRSGFRRTIGLKKGICFPPELFTSGFDRWAWLSPARALRPRPLTGLDSVAPIRRESRQRRSRPPGISRRRATWPGRRRFRASRIRARSCGAIAFTLPPRSPRPGGPRSRPGTSTSRGSIRRPTPDHIHGG